MAKIFSHFPWVIPPVVGSFSLVFYLYFLRFFFSVKENVCWLWLKKIVFIFIFMLYFGGRMRQKINILEKFQYSI